MNLTVRFYRWLYTAIPDIIWLLLPERLQVKIMLNATRIQ